MNMSKKTVSVIALVALTSLSTMNAWGKPLKVFILVGQSNMQGQAQETTLAGLAMDPETKPLYNKLVDANGKTRTNENVYIVAFSRTDGWGKIGDAVEKHGQLTSGYGGNLTDPGKLGPELGFGAAMGENLKEPILLIKTSWGGKSLKCDFRPPSAGPYEFAEEPKDHKNNKGEMITAKEMIEKRKEATGKYYRLMLEHIRSVLADPGKYCPAYNPKNGYEIAGFAWFQGFNDLVGDYPPLDASKGKGGGKNYSDYSRLLACFIRDVRKDLSAPNMPFVIGVLGVGGKNAGENTDLFRKAMAAPAAMEEFKGTVTAVNTADFWDEKLGELEERKGLTKDLKGRRKAGEDKYTALREKIAPLQKELDSLNEAKGKDRDKKKIDELQQKIQNILFTPEEQDYIAKNRSNQGYHYLGSAKTYSRIGEALANAIIELNKKK
jgi:Carbohydrate esterase, sialic acid-specific acetylesterase